MALQAEHLPALLAAFDLGRRGRLSDGPVASGRLGSVWRLDTGDRSWAVKEVAVATANDLAGVEAGAAFQEAAVARGIPAPAIRRTPAGELIADVGGVGARIQAWVDLREPDLDLDPVELGRLVAELHQVEVPSTIGVDPWYSEPVGAARWSELITTLRGRRASFADDLARLVPEILDLERLLGAPPRALRTCHRDLWADNVRRTRTGGLCVFDFDNAGLADPSQELAAVLVEYAADASRGRAIRVSYEEAGGPGRVEDPSDFAMPIAQLLHIVEEGCRRWLVAETPTARDDNEAWVREFLDRPVTRSLIDRLLAT
jgi:Ser/Thr protein kinase RdoA (MazF antagonist)